MMTSLWNAASGTPLNPHGPCPSCEDAAEVGSHFDEAWCCQCGWRGSLTRMHELAAPVEAVDPVRELLIEMRRAGADYYANRLEVALADQKKELSDS